MASARDRIQKVFRHTPPNMDKLLVGMTRWGRELDRRFQDGVRRRAEFREAMAPVAQKLEQKLQLVEEIAAARSKFQPPKRPAIPPISYPKHTDRIFGGSVGATYGPPYDVQWTWSQQEGPSVYASVTSADANSGTMQLEAVSGGNNSAIAARAAVGNWLIAPLGTSTMRISAAPAFSWWEEAGVEWWFTSAADSAGWCGFVVESYDQHNGDYVATVLEQQTPIWQDGIGNFGIDQGQGSTSGFPLQAEFTAYEGLFYTVWIWFGVYAWTTNDYAVAEFPQIAVPYFAWENGL
jgi:hypothetical protein